MPPPLPPPRTWLLIGLLAWAATPALAQPRVPASAGQLFVQGLTRAYLGDHAGAISLYEQALAQRPREGAIYAALSDSYEAEGNLPAALLHAQRAAEAAPTEPDVHRALARLHLTAGNPDAAVAAQERLVALAPRDPNALSLLARTQHQVGRFADALATYERLLEVSGESPAIRSRMLPLYRRLDDPAGAAGALEAMLPYDPGNTALAVELALTLSGLDRPAEAVRVLEAVLDAHPGDPEATLALAALYRELGNDGAAEALVEALPPDPPRAPEDALARAATLYAHSDGDPQALRAARDLLEALPPPLPPPALLLLGDLRLRDGEAGGAALALREALAADPAHPEGWALLTAAYLADGDARTAAEVAEDGLLLFPGQYPLLRAAVPALAAAERPRAAAARALEALAILAEEAPAERSEHAFFLEHLGDAEAAQGRPDEAARRWREALRLDPGRPGLERKLEGLP